MSDYEPLRVHVEKFVGKKDALREFVGKLLDHLDNCKTDRFQFKCSLMELGPLKPKPQPKPKGAPPTGYWAGHSTVSLGKSLVEAIKILSEPGERLEDVVRRLVEAAVTEHKDGP